MDKTSHAPALVFTEITRVNGSCESIPVSSICRVAQHINQSDKTNTTRVWYAGADCEQYCIETATPYKDVMEKIHTDIADWIICIQRINGTFI